MAHPRHVVSFEGAVYVSGLCAVPYVSSLPYIGQDMLSHSFALPLVGGRRYVPTVMSEWVEPAPLILQTTSLHPGILSH